MQVFWVIWRGGTAATNREEARASGHFPLA